MIEKLWLQNFQSHKNSELELSPGVNVIVGESGSGKTAILRSLYWLIFGKPSGTSIVRHHIKTNCQVSAWLDNEEPIARIRGKTENCYLFGDEEYRGFGQNVPEPVAKAFNMSDINFTRQLDAPFLLSKSPGEVAQYLNKLVNLDVIENSLSRIGSLSRQWSRDKETLIRTIQNLEEKLEETDWVEEAEQKVQAIEKEQQKYDRRQAVVSRISRELSRHYSAMEQLESCPDHRPLEKRLLQAASIITEYNTASQVLKTLHSAVEQLKNTSTALIMLEPYKGLEQRILDVERERDKHNTITNNITGLKGLLKDHAMKECDTKTFRHNESLRKKELEENMPEVCPLCEQPTGDRK